MAQCRVQYDIFYELLQLATCEITAQRMRNESENFFNFARGCCMITSLSLANKCIMQGM